MFQVMLISMAILGFVGMGLFLVIGTIRRIEYLVKVPEGHLSHYPYWYLKKAFGEQSVYYYHIFAGMVFVIGGVGIMLWAFYQ